MNRIDPLPTLPAPEQTTMESVAALHAGMADSDNYRNAVNRAIYTFLTTGCYPRRTYGAFLLESRTEAGKIYRISDNAGCSCPAAERGLWCWHAALCILYAEAVNFEWLRGRDAINVHEVDAAMLECFDYDQNGI